MSVTQTLERGELVAFVERVRREFAQAGRVLKETRTLSATNTFQAYQRVPGTDLVVAVSAPSPWAQSQDVQAVVVLFDGKVIHGDPKAAAHGPPYADVFLEAPEVDVVIHVHGPYLGAWAGPCGFRADRRGNSRGKSARLDDSVSRRSAMDAARPRDPDELGWRSLCR